MPAITILGAGHFGTALSRYLRAHTAHTPTVASRSTPTTPQLAVRNADVVILATPSSAFPTLIPLLLPHLRDGATFIDASNPPLTLLNRPSASSVHTLRKLLPPAFHLAKAFNTLSAFRLQDFLEGEDTQHASLPFAAEDPALKTVSALIADMHFTPVYKGDLQAAEEVESLPRKLFPTYRGVFVVAAVVWAWWILYSTLSTYVIHGGRGEPSRPWEKASLSILMATTGETAQTLFAVTFLAGPVATLCKAVGRPLAPRLVHWLDRRKQLGLAAFVFVSAHGIAGAVSASHLDDGWKGRLYFVFGIISYVAFALLAVCSSGSTARSLSWAEFRAVFSWLGTFAFVFGIVHQGFWGAIILQHVPDPSFWVGGGRIMPIYWLGIILPIFVVLLRFITWTPCVISAAEKRGISTKTFNPDDSAA